MVNPLGYSTISICMASGGWLRGVSYRGEKTVVGVWQLASMTAITISAMHSVRGKYSKVTKGIFNKNEKEEKIK